MKTAQMCSLCKQRELLPEERKGGVFLVCSNCDSPGGKMPVSDEEEVDYP